MSTKQRFSDVAAQVLTMTGLQKRGFFVKYPYIGEVDKGTHSFPEIEAIFESHRTQITDMIEAFSRTLPDLNKSREELRLPRRWMFPLLDAIAAYHIVREYQPKRIVEIGSGFSSHVLAQALADNGTGHLTCIDPQPRISIEAIGAKFERRVLSREDATLVRDFEPGDILFIDSSHIMLPGMDVDIQFNRMFPNLPHGTIVHVHDIFLPDGYPPHWHHRYYSEQNALIGWIVSGYFDVIYPGYYAATRLEPEIRRQIDGIFETDTLRAGSIWLQRRHPG